ncbi:sir2 family domain-containing protein [Ditylenchus destructor]|nr:sir2 family domain-containing protein [Ditylenchus destructor]
MKRPSSNMAEFQSVAGRANYIVVLSGAGISAESGIPTFRGAGGLWRSYQATDLATPQAFSRDPSLVWEFYHYRREVVLSKQPNAAHMAISDAEAILDKNGKKVIVVTQNIDGLHQASGSKNVVELHGSLFKTRCTKCHSVEINRDSPICESLRSRGAPDVNAVSTRIPTDHLPKCKECSGLLRPHVVWFGEGLDNDVMEAANYHLDRCDLCLVIGTSSVVYPAAMFAPSVAARGVPVAEFNIEATTQTSSFGYHFEGPSSQTVPLALAEILKRKND